jgi:four helix bundle protein
MPSPATQPTSVTPQVLEDRLIAFGADVCGLLRKMPGDAIGTQIRKQLVRSATSPAANYAEARAAESRRDFVHKMQICLKELRESLVWLRFTDRLCRRSEEVAELADECGQLIAIFVASIKTAKSPRSRC